MKVLPQSQMMSVKTASDTLITEKRVRVDQRCLLRSHQFLVAQETGYNQ